AAKTSWIPAYISVIDVFHLFCSFLGVFFLYRSHPQEMPVRVCNHEKTSPVGGVLLIAEQETGGSMHAFQVRYEMPDGLQLGDAGD
ncbi:hypothetical protein XENOCAPTIV_018473, partial [Xenoophorus captivus]